ncbi:MAG: hypothetical protein NTX03_10975 [Bacteroidetes bacterium]|nr:hypothetical protein [Bacteroidota bacterium]
MRPHVAPLTYWDALADLNEDVRNCVLKFGVVGHMPEIIHYNEVRK